jgi:excisionase family DNA binding protein
MDNFYTPEQIAERLQLEKTTVYQWLRQRKIYGIKLGKVWRIPEAEFEKSLTNIKPQKKSIRRKFDVNTWRDLDLKGLPKDCKYDRNLIYSGTEQDN